MDLDGLGAGKQSLTSRAETWKWSETNLCNARPESITPCRRGGRCWIQLSSIVLSAELRNMHGCASAAFGTHDHAWYYCQILWVATNKVWNVLMYCLDRQIISQTKLATTGYFDLFQQSGGVGVRDVDDSHNTESSRKLGDNVKSSWGNPPKNFFGDDIPLGAKREPGFGLSCITALWCGFCQHEALIVPRGNLLRGCWKLDGKTLQTRDSERLIIFIWTHSILQYPTVCKQGLT